MQFLRHARAFPLCLAGLLLVSCGGSSRVLESISLSPSPAFAKNGSVQLVATGTYSSAPLTVSGIRVNWNPTLCTDTNNSTACPQAIAAPEVTVSASGLAACVKGFSGTAPVEVTAPKNPSISPDATGVATVSATGSVVCP